MSSGYQQAREAAAFDERLDRGRVLFTGADARPFLHALLTNDITSLAPGSGCYAALLTQQGRMIADMQVLLPDSDPPTALLVVHSDDAATLAGRFDKSIFSEDVAVADISASSAHFSIVGPRAVEVLDAALAAAGYEPVAATVAKPFDNRELPGALIWRDDAFLPLGLVSLNISVPLERRDALRTALAANAVELTPAERETLRVEAGRPELHVDMTHDTIPLEADLLDRAISTSKGCYVGQEVIIRILHRGGGRVAKRLASLEFDVRESRVPARGATLHAEEREVGRVTSAVWSPAMNRAIGLGYVHRDFANEDAALTLDDGAPVAITRVSAVE